MSPASYPDVAAAPGVQVPVLLPMTDMGTSAKQKHGIHLVKRGAAMAGAGMSQSTGGTARVMMIGIESAGTAGSAATGIERGMQKGKDITNGSAAGDEAILLVESHLALLSLLLKELAGACAERAHHVDVPSSLSS